MTEPSRPFLRRSLAVLLALAWLVIVVIGSLFLSLASETLGWLYVGLFAAVGWAAAALLWQPTSRRLGIGAAVVVGLALGFLLWSSAPPTHERIADRADEVPIPDDWQEVRTDETGSTWCFKGCPQVSRTYEVPEASYDVAARDLVDAFVDAGWSDDSSGGTVGLDDGRWHASISEDYPPGPPVEITVTFSG